MDCEQVIELPLTRGCVALIDAEDAAQAAFKWSVRKGNGGNLYAIRNSARDAAGRRRTLSLHREIMGLTDPEAFIDHIDGNGLNCRRQNMRITDRFTNGRNRAGPVRSGTSPYLGVSFHKGRQKWQAHIGIRNRTKYLGLFDTPEAAHAARLAAERDLWGIQPRRATVHNSQPGDDL